MTDLRDQIEHIIWQNSNINDHAIDITADAILALPEISNAQAKISELENALAAASGTIAAMRADRLADLPDHVRWAADQWQREVANRPMVNAHRRTLDDTWRQVIRHHGGDDVFLCGATHDTLAALKPKP
jgi:hypothetical protein